MKQLISLILLTLLSFSAINAQTSKVSKDPAGEWKYEAPYAPSEYSAGVIKISFADKKYSAVITLPWSDYKINGENVKYENDSLTFSVYIEGESISIVMKMDDASKMTGKALYSMGEIPLTAKRVEK
ncbi:MAG TPA: hypothetical protein PLO24_09485 [Bacteroidales bacterium]|jgi:hypothetical protein|nr:hypothetical protein [Bacteroidales bacterium]HOS72147.1 hypothetical protein [Bacteroidales bacterium]HQH23566.1 hypothetical protein [Bacteroidales bacterium]HQJ81088.1 hypothetical protein [Bacteroidales bacterium]